MTARYRNAFYGFSGFVTSAADKKADGSANSAKSAGRGTSVSSKTAVRSEAPRRGPRSKAA